MFCKNCGKEIDDKAVVCVHCGVATEGAATAAAPVEDKKVNALGIAGVIVSFFSLGLGIYFCIASIVGLVLSIVGMVQSKKCTLNGFAIAGLVLGIISLIIWGLVWLIVGAAIIGMGGTPA